MIVQKCCFCCSLKYGFLTWAIINFLGRLCCAGYAYFAKYDLTPIANNYYGISDNRLYGLGFGWSMGTALIVFAALKGIVEKRYILMYPYIVVLLVEVFVFLAFTIYMAFMVTAWYLLEVFVVGAINTYTIVCLVSYYSYVKELRKTQQHMESVPFKNI